MAIFGAPVTCADHAYRALAAAIDMFLILTQLNQDWEKRGEPSFDIGIGINSGNALVGNIGNPERMEYTAIGEEVNLAARLEALTKNLGTPVVISAQTKERITETNTGWEWQELCAVEVRGFTHPVLVYTVKITDATVDK
jgi:adenylate cyclase